MLAKHGYLPEILLKLQDKLPLCVACQFGTAHQCPWCTKGKKSGSIQKPNQTKPGDGVSVDQIITYISSTRFNTSNGWFPDKQTNMGMHHIC
jgi:hypothetical protein